jgi:hypothetical protein
MSSNYSAEFKTMVVLEALKEDAPSRVKCIKIHNRQ